MRQTMQPAVRRSGPAPAHAPMRGASARRPSSAATSDATTTAHGAFRLADAALSGAGERLSPALRAYFEPRFNRSFSDVRLHTDGSAADAAQGLQAAAFAHGRNIALPGGAPAASDRRGLHLLAHELAHVAQDPAGHGPIRRQPEAGKGESETKPEGPERPPDEVAFKPVDLLVYPLFVDLWNDIFRQNLTDTEKSELKLKGTEGAAFWNLVNAVPFGGMATPAGADFGELLKNWIKHAEELHRISGGSDLYMDAISRLVGLNVEKYLASDLFKLRLKSHALSLGTIYVVAQSIASTVQAVKEPAAQPGQFEPSQWEKQTDLLKTILNKVLKAQFTAPDFFNLGPLKLSTHPAYAFTPTPGSAPPAGVTFEHKEGMGQEGSQYKFGATLNLAQLAGMAQEEGPSSTDIANLGKHRGAQGSLWFSYEKTDPTQIMREAGSLPESKFRAGTILGAGGFMSLLETGGRYGGEDSLALTSWFIHGGFGYNGKTGDVLQKIGFDVVLTDWKEQDPMAPKEGPEGAPVAGTAARFTPFAKVQFGDRHKVSLGAALGFVTGTHENFGLSDARADLSYTFMGDRAADQLPLFKLDLSGSLSRLDWYGPDSPLMKGVQARASIDQFFLAGQVQTGAGQIPEARATQLGEAEKVKVPTTALFTAGAMF